MRCNTILIVEDEESIRDMMRLILELEGYRVYVAANGREALDMLERVRPGLILLDLMMPVMNGWQFVDEIDKEGKWTGVPIVVVTAFGDKAGAIRADGVLRKPVDIDALFTIVQRYCGGPAQEEESR